MLRAIITLIATLVLPYTGCSTAPSTLDSAAVAKGRRLAESPDPAGVHQRPSFARSREVKSDMVVYRLRCEYRENPLGIDQTRPRLSWQLQARVRGRRQSAYHILVADDPDRLHVGQANLWDSGKVESQQSLHVVYGGKPLASRRHCYWTVRVWDEEGRRSSWSPSAEWEMGLLRSTDWIARWIDDGCEPPAHDQDYYEDDPAPFMRRAFQIAGQVRSARLYITGLGLYESWINGTRVGDAVLDPLWTNFSKRVFYATYDVTDLIHDGENVLGVTLGNGWFNPLPMRMWGYLNLREHLTVGRPMLLAQLEIELEDGSRQIIASDEQWKTTGSPILRNNIYLGEKYDARLESPGWNQPGYDDSAWRPVSQADGVSGGLQCRPVQPIRVLGTLLPASRSEPQPGVYLFDFGQNFAGWVRLKIQGPRGASVRLRFGELKNPDGTLNVMTSVCGQIKSPGKAGPGAPAVAEQADTYILRGGDVEMYTPRFTFHGFRYVEVTGYPGVPAMDAVEGSVLGCDIDPVGSFECSSDELNRIHTMVRQTFRSNLFGVQSDCPHRERFGYGGDIVATCEAFLMDFDMSSFYPKVITDFADAARPDGGLTTTAPCVGVGSAGLTNDSGPIGWQIVHPRLLREVFRHYGDRRILEEQYETARRWIEFVRANTDGLIVNRGLSDHESLEAKPIRTTSTGFFFEGARLVSELATILGRDDDARRYAALATDIQKAFVDELCDGKVGIVENGGQAAQATALYHDLLPARYRPAVFKRLLSQLQLRDWKLSTGIFGTNYVLAVLTRMGRNDLACRIVTDTRFPGWGFMLERGATTLWEHWAFSDDVYSHNHPMFGSVDTWFYRGLAGIAPDRHAVGFDKVVFRPEPVDGVSWVRARYDSIRGPIVSDWAVRDGTFDLEIELPVGVTGEVFLPERCDLSGARESGQPLGEAACVEVVNSRHLRVASGHYRFAAPFRSPQPAYER